MKKKFLLILVMSLLLTGCGRETKKPVEESTTEESTEESTVEESTAAESTSEAPTFSDPVTADNLLQNSNIANSNWTGFTEELSMGISIPYSTLSDPDNGLGFHVGEMNNSEQQKADSEEQSEQGEAKDSNKEESRDNKKDSKNKKEDTKEEESKEESKEEDAEKETSTYYEDKLDEYGLINDDGTVNLMSMSATEVFIRDGATHYDSYTRMDSFGGFFYAMFGGLEDDTEPQETYEVTDGNTFTTYQKSTVKVVEKDGGEVTLGFPVEWAEESKTVPGWYKKVEGENTTDASRAFPILTGAAQYMSVPVRNSDYYMVEGDVPASVMDSIFPSEEDVAKTDTYSKIDEAHMQIKILADTYQLKEITISGGSKKQGFINGTVKYSYLEPGTRIQVPANVISGAVDVSDEAKQYQHDNPTTVTDYWKD